MVTLSSLLVQRGVASMRAVEESIARQVLHGGDLATAVLEGGAVAEQILTPLFAESLGLPPAIGRLRPASPETLRVLPPDLASQHRIFPLELRRGAGGGAGAPDTLVIATSEPLAPAVEEDLAFMLAASIQQVAAPLVRIRQAQAEHYGLPLDRRLMRLAARLDGRPDPSPSVMPGSDPTTLPAPPPPEPASPRRPTLRGMTSPLAVQPPPEPAAPEISPHTVPTLVPPAAPSEPPPPPPVTEAGSSGSAPARGQGARALSGWVQRALAGQETPPATAPPPPAAAPARDAPAPARPARPRSVPPPRGRRRGPFTIAMAEEELARVETTEAVLDVLFDFAQQYFVYTALFAVHGDVAQGRRASGPGASAAEVAAIRIGLDAPGLLAEARERGAPRVAPLAAQGGDLDLSLALGRAPVAAAVVPVSVRGRVVALVYGDDGDAPAELGELGDLIALAALATPVLERVILRRKLNRQGHVPSAPPPPELRFGPSQEPAGAAPADAHQDSVLGPLSARTRAELLQSLRGHPDDVTSTVPTPPVDAWEMRSDEATSSAPTPRQSDDSQIETVARAFGLRGTGVEDMAPLSIKSIAGALRQTTEQAGPTPMPPAPPHPISPAAADFATAPTIEMPAPRGSSHPPPGPDDADDGGVHPGSLPERVPLSPAGLRRHDRADPGGRATPGSGLAALVQAVIEGGDDAARAMTELLRGGDAAIKAIAARFPGPLWVDRRVREVAAGPRGQEELHRLPPASECGPLLELIVAFRRLALPFMTVRAASPDPETRFWATHVLGELRYAEAANALLPRLFDDDPAVRRVARRAAAALVHEGAAPGKPGSSWLPPAPDGSKRSPPHHAPGAPLIQGLEYILRSPDESLPRKLMAIETAAAIRARSLVPALKAMLEDPHEFLIEAATRALEAIPDDGSR